MKQHKWIAIGLLLLLVVVSLFKDELTPDYRNTLHAAFLDPRNLDGSRISTLGAHPLFWLGSFLYSGCFIILPALIIQYAFARKALTMATLWLHLFLVAVLYAMIFANINLLDVVLVSKINRYLHSPIITLFLWAAFTLTRKQENHE